MSEKFNPVEPIPDHEDTSTLEDKTLVLKDQVVIIELINGSRIKFSATWNHGLGDFVRDYEKYMRGEKQPRERYQMQTAGKDKSNLVNVKFENIIGIHLETKS